MGRCSATGGPGSSGGNKSMLQCDQMLIDNHLTTKAPSNGGNPGDMITIPKYYDCKIN